MHLLLWRYSMFINLQQAALLPLMTWKVVKLLVAPNLFCPQQVLEEIRSHAQRGWQQLLCLTQNFWLITAVLKMGFYTWVWGGGWRKSNVHLKLHKKYPKIFSFERLRGCCVVNWVSQCCWLGVLFHPSATWTCGQQPEISCVFSCHQLWLWGCRPHAHA